MRPCQQGFKPEKFVYMLPHSFRDILCSDYVETATAHVQPSSILLPKIIQPVTLQQTEKTGKSMQTFHYLAPYMVIEVLARKNPVFLHKFPQIESRSVLLKQTPCMLNYFLKQILNEVIGCRIAREILFSDPSNNYMELYPQRLPLDFNRN